MYEKNADIMSSLAGAKDTVSKGALSLLAKLKGTSQNDIDNSVRSQLPPDIASGIDSVRNTVQSQLPSDVSKIVDDLRNQTGGQLADKATKALSDLRTPSALSYIPGIGGALSGLAKDYPGREGIGSRLINTIPEGAAGLAGGAAGVAGGAMGGAVAGPMLAPLIGRLLTRGRVKMEGSVIPNAIKAFRKVKDTINPPSFGDRVVRANNDMLNTVNTFFKNVDRPPIGANWNKGGPGIPMPSEGAGALTGAITGGAAGTNIGSRLWRSLAGDTTNSEKSGEWTPAPSFSANMPLPEKQPNPFVQGKKPSAKADASGAEAALAKLGSQDNCSPSRSAAGDSKGVKYKQQNEDHATGTAAFDSLDKYLRMSKKAGLNDFQTNFFGRLIQEGRNEQELYVAVKHAGDQFGYEVGKELKKGLEKLAIMGVLSGLGRAAMAGGRAIGGGVSGAYSGAKAGIAASGAGKAMGQAGTALGEAGQAARLAGNEARTALGQSYQATKGAIGTGLSDAGGAISRGYQSAKGAIGTGLNNAGTSIGQNFQAAKGAIGEALPGMQQSLGNAATTAGNFLGNNAKTIGAIGAGGGIAYGAAQVPGAVERGVNTAVNQGIDRGMDRFSSHMQQMPGQIGGMANQAMQNLPGQLSGMANQAMQKMPFQMGGQTTGGFAGPYKQSSEKWAARNSIFTDSGRFAGFGSATEDRLNRAGAYGRDLEAVVSKLKSKDFKGLLGKEVFKDIPYNMMQSRNPIGLEAMTTAQNMVDHKVLERAKGMTSLPKQVFNTMRDSPVTKRILATVSGLLKKHPLGAALGAGAAGGMASGAGVAGLMGLGKESSEKRAWAALVSGAKAALPAVGRYMGIGGGMPGAIAKSTYNTAKGISGATTGDAIKAVLKNPQLQGQAITGASTGVMNPFTGLLATGDENEGWGHYLGRSALSGLAGAGAGFAGGRGTQDLMRRMGAGSQIGATGDLVGTIAGYDTGGMGAKGGFIGGGLMPAKVPLWMGDKAKALGGGIPGLPGRMGPTGQIGTAGRTSELLEKLDPLSYLGSAAGSLIGKGYSAVKGNAPGALNAAKGWAKTNPTAASIAGVGGAGLLGGAYLGNRAVNAMEGARGDVNQQMNMFRAQTNNQMNGLREQIGGGLGGVGQFFNENKHWLMPALLAGGGALAGNAVGGGAGAALGGLSLPALYMMSQNGMFGGGGAANPLLASAKPRADYAQQNQQYERENIDKQVADRNRDPRLASPTKGTMRSLAM